MIRSLAVAALLAVSACGGGNNNLVVSPEVRRQVKDNSRCSGNDACGYFLQVVSGGEDGAMLTESAKSKLDKKCEGTIILYRDVHNVLGCGIMLRSAEEKRTCEERLGLTADTEFVHEIVFRAPPAGGR